ncbi:MAG: hypothetical protein N3A72_12350 [bacterium]|nr:hypothetical protein [bacterium]
MEKTDRLIRQGTFFVGIAMAGNVCNVLFNLVMTRSLGPYHYGIFETLLSVLAVIAIPSSVVQLTIARYLAYYSAKHDLDRIRSLLRHAIAVTFVIGCSGGIVLFAARHMILQSLAIQLDSNTPMLILAILFAFGWVLPVFRGGLQGLQQFLLLGLNIIADASIRLIAGIILVYHGFQIAGALGASVVVLMVGFILSGFPLSSYVKKPESQSIPLEVKPILMYAIPVLLYFLGKELFARLDIFIVSRYLAGENQQFRGYYTAAALIGAAFWSLPTAIITVMFPKVAHTHAKNLSPLHLIRKSLFFSGILCGIGIAGCFLFPKLVISILYGAKYPVEIMAPLIQWFSVCITPLALANVLLNYHLAKAEYACIYVLIGGVIFHGILLWIFHQTVYQVLSVIFISGVIQSIANYALMVYKEKMLQGKT